MMSVAFTTAFMARRPSLPSLDSSLPTFSFSVVVGDHAFACHLLTAAEVQKKAPTFMIPWRREFVVRVRGKSGGRSSL